MWYVVDLRTVTIAWISQALLIGAGVWIGLVSVLDEAVDYSTNALVGQAVYRFGILLVCAIGEGLFVQRAMRNESHADLTAAAVLALFLGVGLLLMSFEPHRPTVISPPIWVGVCCALLSCLLLFVTASLYGRFGWRQLMRFGSAPEKRVLYKRLQNQDTLVTLDLLCLMVLGLATTNAMLIAADEGRLGAWSSAWQLYVSCIAWVAGWAYDVALDWITLREKKVLTLVCALLGCVPRAWFLYRSIDVFQIANGDELSPGANASAANASATDASSTAEIDRAMATSQLAVAILSTCVRLAVAVSSVVVALTVYGQNVSLFGDLPWPSTDLA